MMSELFIDVPWDGCNIYANVASVKENKISILTLIRLACFKGFISASVDLNPFFYISRKSILILIKRYTIVKQPIYSRFKVSKC